MFSEAIEAILRDQCTPSQVRAIESGADSKAMWEALAGNGFLELLASEEQGGAGLPLSELFPVLLQFGRHATPLPVGQAIISRALLPEFTVLPDGLLTLAPNLRMRSDGRLTAPLVPYGVTSDYALGSLDSSLYLLDLSRGERVSTGVHGSLTATLTWEKEEVTIVGHDPDERLASFAAAMHAALIVGALTRVFEMTLQYCNERSQFGRTLGKFQAVQHQLAIMAEHVAASSVAAEAAFQTEARVPSRVGAAVAKARTSEAAVLVANLAHALHGAIGMTEEYDLQLLTRRLREWRMTHGSETYWNQWLGQTLMSSKQTLSEFIRLV